ncbi:hypothetical protein GJ744_010448 [Endocarpon pusillum]|uniref:tyrosinase n=1 Tax=Endocarpon pusillum TaxID=364733 RepID=A0A8H7AFZ9_9EURO|nr:hypothetical protein GJ744_010448 [Endocarpon pusillum]
MSDGNKGPVLVTGPPVEPTQNGSLPVRRDVRDLRKNHPEQWALYIRGLQKFQQVTDSEPLSYYRIAGIHGKPYTIWPDKDWNKMKKNPKSGTVGFCTHSSILFLPWHRPFLALFEQELHKHVQKAAQDFEENQPGKKDWKAAAQNFRMPFWDWADPKQLSVFPDEATTAKIKVWTPESYPNEESVDNPLYHYKFSSTSQEGTRNNNQYTWRWLEDVIPGQSEIAAQKRSEAATKKLKGELKSALESKVKDANFAERVCYILQAYKRYGSFSFDVFSAGHPEIYGSMEDIHNSIHGETGGNGHMGGVPYSAFDPIFWLHHTNIDRLFAIWQAIHDNDKPETYVESAKNSGRGGNFTTAQDEEENIETPLKPFNRTASQPVVDSDYWKAKDVRKTKTFGYCYPETEKWEITSNKEVARKEVIRQIDVLYPAGSLANIIREKTKGRMASENLLASRAETIAQVPLKQLKIERQVEDLAPESKYLEWITNLKAKKHALGETFNVHVFLGQITQEDSVLWYADENHVGAFTVLGQPVETGCDKCRSDQADDLQVTAQIPLTVALAERYLAGKIAGLTPDAVIPYLQENLHWRVSMADGSEVPRGDVQDLVVSVVTNEVTIPENLDELPIYAPNVNIYPEITTKTDGATPRGEGTGLTDPAQA